MSSVVVTDDGGIVLGKVRVGDTKLQDLERLGVAAGGLFDRENVGLLNNETLNADDGPYVFKRVREVGDASTLNGMRKMFWNHWSCCQSNEAWVSAHRPTGDFLLDSLNACGIVGLYRCLQVSPGVLFF